MAQSHVTPPDFRSAGAAGRASLGAAGTACDAAAVDGAILCRAESSLWSLWGRRLGLHRIHCGKARSKNISNFITHDKINYHQLKGLFDLIRGFATLCLYSLGWGCMTSKFDRLGD